MKFEKAAPVMSSDEAMTSFENLIEESAKKVDKILSETNDQIIANAKKWHSENCTDPNAECEDVFMRIFFAVFRNRMEPGSLNMILVEDNEHKSEDRRGGYI